MKEGKFEKSKRQKETNLPLKQLMAIKGREMKIKEEDPNYGTPWGGIDPEKLTPDVLELFNLFNGGDVEAAQTKLQDCEIKIQEIKTTADRSSNEQFLQWIDDKIRDALMQKQAAENKVKDNN